MQGEAPRYPHELACFIYPTRTPEKAIENCPPQGVSSGTGAEVGAHSGAILQWFPLNPLGTPSGPKNHSLQPRHGDGSDPSPRHILGFNKH